ncbi:MAG TPA: hypothetical protein GX715_20560 [Armatimonadetes bacterium]|jgi:hypothetical protein|nr:hypothetical protein [Armatimonadota bacterium]HHX42353.1 hypothetical protein [Armatimonadota bacterium]HOM83306.1 hypothetical protein [Armatimonadota bacterium]HOQ27120.1 hypothetical protein [Armatimonadota bacterium]HPO74157.1 hypothetical protein [Armatimonadota bacterium]
MIDAENYHRLSGEIGDCVREDRAMLDQLRSEIRPLAHQVRRIQPRSTTSIAVVGTDGGNNRVQFDPFLIQIIRVVDSSNNEYCLEAVTPSTNLAALSAAQFSTDGSPQTALGRMMAFLNVRHLAELSDMIHVDGQGRAMSPSWIRIYRELVEWAVLFSVVREKEFGTDTIIVYDGLLRSIVFSGNLFQHYLDGLGAAISEHYRRSRRRIYLAGVAKSSKVLARYRLAMHLERILATTYPAYVEVPPEVEQKAYLWPQYVEDADQREEERQVVRLAGGRLFFVKFGSGVFDPIWPVDIYQPQAGEAQTILGCMLADAINGFPVPYYPLCLQKAHENAAMVDMDFDILQDAIFDAIRTTFAEDAPELDTFRFQDVDVSQHRYS